MKKILEDNLAQIYLFTIFYFKHYNILAQSYLCLS